MKKTVYGNYSWRHCKIHGRYVTYPGKKTDGCPECNKKQTKLKIMDKILIKLESMDPTGVAVKSNSFEMTLEPEESMRVDRLFLTIGDYLYRINNKGDIIRRAVPHDNTTPPIPEL